MSRTPMDHEKEGFVHPAVPRLKSQLAKGEVSRREFVRTLALLGVAAPVAYATAGQILGEKPSASIALAQGRRGGTLRYSMAVQEMADPASYPWVERSNVSRQICEYLTITGPDNVTRPYLARSWRPSSDLKTWTFTLNRGVRWHNGDELTSEDVVFNLVRWFDPEVGSSNRGLFGQLTDDSGEKLRAGGVEMVDKYTVRLHLKSASVAIPENFYNYPTAILHRGFEGDLTKNPNGTGPYTLDEFAVSEKASVKRVPGFKYWGKEPLLDRIEWYDHGGNAQASLAALASGQVDALYDLPIDLLPAARRVAGVNIYQANTAVTSVIRMHVTKPPFNDKRVRQALQACCDPSVYPDQVLSGVGDPAEHHHVAPVHPDYSKLPFPRRDIAKAKRLLAEAGYPNGGLEVTVDCGNTDGPDQQRTVELFASQAKEAGIDIKLNVIPAAKYWEIWQKTPFGITAWTHRPLGTMVLSLGYRGGVPWNETEYDSAEFEAALDAAEAVADPKERSKLMERAERILQEDAVIVQPLWKGIAMAAHERVQNITAHPTRYQQLFSVSLKA